MTGAFVLAQHAESNRLDWGSVTWVCHPGSIGASKLAIVRGDLLPERGHNFHKHPRQEEVIFVVSGLIEQWIEKTKQFLRPGDSAFIPADAVHASFNVGDGEAKILAIFGPAVGDGFETIDVSAEAPWNAMRG
jgi:quercetin dioxygenase-like cupin family protein